ncbi:EF-hand domain-containing protein [Streptomyces sp. NPDC050504]|uniref:EF-hand domain-containing protein n=1 Tax=Streptomyces sp. NPDC050504 TaxID=3365618 RepID=UPI0037B2AB93
MDSREFLTAKFEKGFGHLDVDGDGELTEDDHVEMGRRVAVSLGYGQDSAEAERITGAYLRIWREVHLPFVAAGAAGISRSQFIASCHDLARDPQTARTVLGQVAETYLEIADLDRDGQISPGEFFAFQRGHFPGLTREEADEAFARLDADGNGTLSPAEFTGALVDYWISTDPGDNGNWWMGPLDLPRT